MDGTTTAQVETGDALDLAWAKRFLAAGWLGGAGALAAVSVGLGLRPQPMLLAAGSGVVGLALLRTSAMATYVAFDLVLLATTTMFGAVAVVLPGADQPLVTCIVLVVPFACALLPRRRAALQVGYAVFVAGVVLALAARAGRLSTAEAGIRWLLVTTVILSVGLVVQRLSEHLRRRTGIAEAVASLGHRAPSIPDPDELLGEALRLACDLTGADYATALRRRPDDQLAVAAELGRHPISGATLVLASNGSYAGHIMRSTEAFVSSDLRRDPRISPPESLLRRGIISGLAVPVLGARGPLGVLALHFRRRRQFTRDEVAAATALAGMVATVWQPMAAEDG